MEVNHPVAIFAVVMAIIAFYGSTYVVIALNTGWRFGYWIASATFGGVMFLMSIFWIVTALGPRGAEPRWVPTAASDAEIQSVTVGEQSLSSTGAYPGGAWSPAGEDSGVDETEADNLRSAISNCLSTEPEKLPEEEREGCTTAQELIPDSELLPEYDGVAVITQPEVVDIEFTDDSGVLLAQARVVPVTHDPRLAEEQGVAPEDGVAFGPEGEIVPMQEAGFRMVAFHDPGSLRLPAYGSLVISGIYFALHLWGLNRAERRKLSPVAA